MAQKIKTVENQFGGVEIFAGKINIGVFDKIDDDYSYFPRRNEIITGDDYIQIGKELNKLNNSGGDEEVEG